MIRGGRRASQKGILGRSSAIASSSSSANANANAGDLDGSSSNEPQTVGALLAAIATCMTEALRILMFADKRHWGPDEFEQTRALEEALDEAKKDFQEMAPLVHGQFYYENDRTPESLHTLQTLLARFQSHTQTLTDWVRHGGGGRPIDPAWARDTARLRRDLHRAQCRAASRIFAAEQDGGRCLGAFQVYRLMMRRSAGGGKEREGVGVGVGEGVLPWQQQQQQQQLEENGRREGMIGIGMAGAAGQVSDSREDLRGSLEELVPSCIAVGKFQLMVGGADEGDESHDAAFVCDFCEGFIVWPDLRSMPSERMPLAPTAVTGYPHWQARGESAATGEDKTVVFAPLAIANHMPPEPGKWQAGLICPYCEEDTYLDEGEDSSELRYVQDDRGFADLEAFREHLEWYHTAMPVPPISALASALPSTASSCGVM
ncbi:hypothetical protein N658DRAFT_564722 [Parathielavia hyrcaniae]|uniref:Uncharacterized protein n=1 Tax=Parathielavia hyrcaniae TaxID=113614 RepID=A0AAN6T5P4_9PEZI|nr:hypothetical protein N658DRAFT_564722 [Parathielavia hyrcaniae]